jgi:hypothetical protein
MDDILGGGLTKERAEKKAQEAAEKEKNREALKEKLAAKGLDKDIKNANEVERNEVDLDQVVDNKDVPEKESLDPETSIDGTAVESKVVPLNDVEGQAQEQQEPELKDIMGQEQNVNLESGEIKVVIKQQTDKGNDISFICEFDDLFDDELVVNAPKNSLPSGSEVAAAVTLRYNGQKVVIKSKGKIEEIEEHDNYKDKLIIRLDDITQKKVEDFMDLYEERQKNINEFMELAKGY